MSVRTVSPFVRNRGTGIADYLVGHGVHVAQVDVDADGNLVVDADVDVSALLAAYAPPTETGRMRDQIDAAIRAGDPQQALTRLLAAVNLRDGS